MNSADTDADIIKAFGDFYKLMALEIDRISKTVTEIMQRWGPLFSEIHRADVRAVRTAYRKKKRGRW